MLKSRASAASSSRKSDRARRRPSWRGSSAPKAISPGLVAAAKAAKDDNLLEGFLAEKGEWKELAAIDAKTDLNKLVHESAADRQPAGEKLAKIITARNLAGEKLACDEAVAAVIKAIRELNRISSNPGLLTRCF